MTRPRRAVCPRLGDAVRTLPGDRDGATAVEFALLAPVLFMLMMGVIQFSLTFNNYIELTEAVRTGARTFAVGRATASTTPYSSTVAVIKASAGNLTPGSISIATTVNGTACTTDSACTTALSTASGKASVVTATYPCNLTVMAVNFVPGCSLQAQTSDLVE